MMSFNLKRLRQRLLTLFAVFTVMLSASLPVLANGTTPPVHSAGSINMSCVTSWPTTTHVVRTESDLVNVTVIHHNGTKYMPIHEGIVVPNDIAIIERKARVLSKLGTRMSFQWPTAHCSRTSAFLFKCSGGGPTEVNGVTLTPFAIFTSIQEEQGIAGRVVRHQVSLHLIIDGESFITTMNYEPTDCEIQPNP
jgi:hypothetical protein